MSRRDKVKKVCVLVWLVASVGLCGCGKNDEKRAEDTELVSGQTCEVAYAETENTEVDVTEVDITEPIVYTFLQGQKSYEKEKIWSGSWCNYEEGGQTFGHFGCSFCCMANIYDTLSPYECSPLDFMTFTKEITSYTPSSGSAALGWLEMKQAMEAAGITCELGMKDDNYEQFAEKMSSNRTAIVLVCSSNDDTIWQNEGGHYVSIWDYETENGEVFLADPASPTRNRTWVSLRNVYDALKTSSSYQYLLVNGYEETADIWKRDGINEDWYQ